MTTLSAEVAEAVRLRDAATPGPWRVSGKCSNWCKSEHCNYTFVYPGSFLQGTGFDPPDAALIAAAPSHVDLIERLFAQLEQARTEFTAAVDAEPELPGDMPDEMWLSIRDDRDAATEAMRIVVRQTKCGIKARISERP